MNLTARIAALFRSSGSAQSDSARAAAVPALTPRAKGSGARPRRLPLAIFCALALLTSLAFASSASAAPIAAKMETISNVSYTSAHVTGKISSPCTGFCATNYSFQYATSESGPWNPGPGGFIPSKDGPFENKLVEGDFKQVHGLKGETKYFVRLTVSTFFVGEALEAVDPAAPPYPSFTTLAVDPPTIPGTVEATPVFSTSATAKGTVKRPANADPAFDVTCHFEYITDAQFLANQGNTDPGFTGATPVPCTENPLTKDSVDAEGEQLVTAPLTGLEPATTYHLRLVAENAGPGVVTKEASNFTTAAKVAAPSVIAADNATQVEYTQAHVAGEVRRPAGKDPALDVTCNFEYITDAQFKENDEVLSVPGFEGATPVGCEPENPVTSADGQAVDKPVFATLSGLSPSTTYHLRLGASNQGGSAAKEAALTFTTAGPIPTPTVIKVNDATDLSYRIATLSGEVQRPAGTDPALDIASCRFEYVTDEQFTNSEFAEATPVGCDQTAGGPIGSEGPTPVSASLTGLKSGVTYHYRLAAENSGGTDTKDATSTFTTIPDGEPTATLDPSPIGGPTKVRLTGTASRGLGFGDSELYVIFQYAEAGTENFCCGNGANQKLPSGSGPLAYSYDLEGLSEDTEYEFRILVEERNSAESSGEIPSSAPYPTATTGHLEAPTATIDPVTDFTATTAHFTGTVDPHAPAGPLNALQKEAFATHWEFVCVPDCKNANGNPIEGTVQGEEGSQPVFGDAVRLDPNTHYEVSLVIHSEGGEATVGPESFDTDKSPPSVKQTPGAPDGTGGYVLEGVVNPHNETVTGCEFKWGPDANQFAFSEDCSPLPGPRGEVQSVTLRLIIGGAFRLSFRGQTTGDIPWDAQASVVQSQLESLSTIGPAGVSVTDSPNTGDTRGYRVVFSGPLAGTDVEALDIESGIPPLTTSDFSGFGVTTLLDGGNNSPITVEAHLTGLNPDAVYRSLLVVTYGAGLEVDSGEPVVFKPTLAAKQPCPANEGLRTENNSLALPECRAYEMISPPGKEGFGAELETYDGGTRVAYATAAGNLAKSGQNSAAQPNRYVAARTATGWQTIPNLNGSSGSLRDAPGYVDSTFGRTVLQAYSSDLLSSVWSLHQKGEPGVFDSFGDFAGFPHLRTPDGTFAPIGSMLQGDGSPGSVSASDDLSHIVNLGGPTEWGPGVYEYVGTGNAQPRRVDLDNSDAPISTCTQGGGAQTRSVSSDGTRIVLRVIGGCGADNPPAGQIWARVNGTTAFDVSASQCDRTAADPGGLCNGPAAPGGCVEEFKALTGDIEGPGCRTAKFAAATPDGSRVFFTTTQQLVNGDTDQTNDIYACDIPSGNPAPSADKANHCAALRQVSGAQTGAAVESVNATSEDGSTVLFTAKGVLADNEDALKEEAVPGDHNLYVWRTDPSHSDGQTVFVGRLDADDLSIGTIAVGGKPQATPDGRYLVFTTASRLLDTDTDTARDVYRYDADSGDLTRASTNVFGVAGNGDDFDADILSENEPRLGVPARLVHPAVSDDGTKIVFTTTEALSPADGNAEPDVYLWTPARVSLISTGSSGSAPRFNSGAIYVPRVAIDPSGEDIYFESAQQLTPADVDSSNDVYDARVGGGFSFAPPPICTGETCQPPASNPPAVPTPAANRPKPVENAKPPKPCPKGKVRKKSGKCVPKHKKHHKKKGKGKKASHKQGGGK